MDRPRLLPGQLEAVQQPQHAALAVADLEALLDQAAKVAGTPNDAAVPLRIGTTQDDRLEHCLLARVEAAGATGAVLVAQTGHTLDIVAVHPVTQGLAGHAGQPRRFFAWHALQRVGKRQQTGADTAIVLVAGEAAQLGGAAVATDR
jgi:hypothetical protein